jgi:hypothetical protein
MSYQITHWLGDEDTSPGSASFGPLFDELAIADAEHPDVFVTHESGWSLGVNRARRAYWHNVEDLSIKPRHLDSIDKDKFIELAIAVANGDFPTVEAEDWQPGY